VFKTSKSIDKPRLRRIIVMPLPFCYISPLTIGLIDLFCEEADSILPAVVVLASAKLDSGPDLC